MPAVTPPAAVGARPPRPLLLLSGLGGLCFVGLLLVLHQFDPAHSSFYPGCTFHQLTGLNCPGCGGLRATHQLLHGRVLTACHHNVLVVLGAPLVAAWAGHWLWRRWRGIPPKLRGPSTAWWWSLLGAMLAFSVLRNLPFPPFTGWSP